MNDYVCINGTCKCRYCGRSQLCTDYPKTTTSPRGHTLRCKTCTRDKVRIDRGYKAPQKYIAERPCIWCGTLFKGCKTTATYCSRNCKANAARRPDVCAIHIAYCLNCGTPFTAPRKRAYCSPICSSRHHYLTSFTPVQPRPASCTDCGQTYTQTHGRNTRCAPCVQMRTDAMKAKYKAQRRAHETFTQEPINRTAVYERDNWTCYICHQPVNKNAPNNHPRQPTLDHVWPLSLGGTHTLDNVRLACRDCNTQKGASFLVSVQPSKKSGTRAPTFSGRVQIP